MTLFLGGAAADEDWGEGVDVVPLRFDPRSRVRRVLAEQTLLPRAVRGRGAGSAAQPLQHGARAAAGPAGDDDPRRRLQAPSRERAAGARASRSSSRSRRAARPGSSPTRRPRRATSSASSAFRPSAWTSRRSAPGSPKDAIGPAAGGDPSAASSSATRRSCSACSRSGRTRTPRASSRRSRRCPRAFSSSPDTRPATSASSTNGSSELELGDRVRLLGLGRRRDARRPLPRGRLLRLPLARRGLRPAGARGDAPRRAGRVLERHLAPRGRRRRGAPLRPARRRGDRRLGPADPRGPRARGAASRRRPRAGAAVQLGRDGAADARLLPQGARDVEPVRDRRTRGDRGAGRPRPGTCESSFERSPAATTTTSTSSTRGLAGTRSSTSASAGGSSALATRSGTCGRPEPRQRELTTRSSRRTAT